MATELEKILGEGGQEPNPPSEQKPEEPKVEPKEKAQEENPEAKKAQEHLANIRKAIDVENQRLQDIRKQQKAAKKPTADDEEVLPSIDMSDPSAKAWDKRIKEEVAPAKQELEKAKEERRLFTLRQFLTDKPALAKDPERIKAMMQTYDRIRSSTELTSEGIMMDLEKAYAAEHSQELIELARQRRADDARNDAIFSDAAVTRGSTAYSAETPKKRSYSKDEEAILTKWGMTPEEHAKIVQEQQKKA